MVVHWIIFHCKGLLRFSETYELNWDNPTLMNELEEAMLAICAWLSKVHDSGGIIHYDPL
jgi:hypothetical protein